jgi:hypothetical protein
MSESRRQLILLSSFRPSSKYRQTIDQEEAAAFLHGYFALWHPAVIVRSSGPPVIGSHYEYDQPQPNHLFALPEIPSNYQPGDWEVRTKDAGSLIFASSADWQATLSNLAQSLGRAANELQGVDYLPFISLGLGYLVLEAFCEAQDHANPLTSAIFYEELRKAAEATESETRQSALKQAAQLLLQAREVVYPSQIYQALTFILNEASSADRLRLWLHASLPMTLVGSSDILQAWANTDQELVNALRERVQAGTLDWWGGPHFDQEDAALPRAAWLKNLSKGLKQAQQLLNKPVESAGRRRFAATPTLPTLLHHFGFKRSLGISFDGGSWPHSPSSLTAWRGPDSKLIETCNRKSEPIHDSQTWFHLGNLLYESSLNESVAWLHLGATTLPAEIPLLLKAWAKLHELAPVFGQLGTLENAIREIPATEQFTPPGADDFQSDYLVDLTGQGHLSKSRPDPISRFAQAATDWRNWEAARTLLALWSAITPPSQELSELSAQLHDWSDGLLQRWQADGEPASTGPETADEIKNRLAQRLLSHATAQTPGYLVFNPCSFQRRIPVHLEQATTLLPAPAYASQRDGSGISAAVEVPPLGFAWLPRGVEKGTKVRIPKNSIIDGNTLRNEYLQVDVDPQTGGIKAIRDAQKQVARLGQQLIFGPGSSMRCASIQPSRQGHAVGEIISTGILIDSHEQTLANFQQTFRLWAGCKRLEINIHLEPITAPSGYPWHSYYAARWAWRDPSTQLYKSVHGTKLPIIQTRPETPGFIELEMPGGRTAIFSGGLPFWQRHGTRMLDTLLVVAGETSHNFTLAVTIDDDLPHQSEQDWLTSPLFVPVDKGTPASGVASWLFHIDAPSVLLTDMHIDPANSRALTASLQETVGYATEAQLRCPKNPVAASTVNAWGEEIMKLRVADDVVFLHVGCYEMQSVRIQF